MLWCLSCWCFLTTLGFWSSTSASFFESLVVAWGSLDGSFSVVRSSLVMGSSSPHSLTLVSGMTTKSCYQFLLSENLHPPHCVVKFLPTFGALSWSNTWRELHFFDTDRCVIDLSSKIAHGVLYTVARLALFGYDLNTSCFCGPVSQTLEHLFFYCPLACSVFPGSSLWCLSLPRWPLLWSVVMLFLVLILMSCWSFLAVMCTSSMFVSSSFAMPGMTFASGMLGLELPLS